DVGNSRIKWGRCTSHAVAEVVALPPDDPVAWCQQLERWQSDSSMTWAVSGVHPGRSSRLVDWLQQRGHRLCVLERAGQLPLRVSLEHPDRVGMDRLLNAVAASSRRGR